VQPGSAVVQFAVLHEQSLTFEPFCFERSDRSTPADDSRDLADTVEIPAITDDGEDLMARRQVVRKFGVISAAVAERARRNLQC